MNQNLVGNQLMRALLARYEAERQDAIAVMQLYLNSAVGIGDHPNILTELGNATEKLANAEEALSTLNRNFLQNTEEPEENE